MKTPPTPPKQESALVGIGENMVTTLTSSHKHQVAESECTVKV